MSTCEVRVGETRGEVRPSFSDAAVAVEKDALRGVDRRQSGLDSPHKRVVHEVNVEGLACDLYRLVGAAKRAQAVVWVETAIGGEGGALGGGEDGRGGVGRRAMLPKPNVEGGGIRRAGAARRGRLLQESCRGGRDRR